MFASRLVAISQKEPKRSRRKNFKNGKAALYRPH